MSAYGKSFIRYVSFNILGMVGVSCYILADTLFISNKLGSDGLAALNIAMPMFSVQQGLGLMIATGGATRFSLCKARGDADGARSVLLHSIVSGLVVGLLLSLLGLFAARPLARALGADASIVDMTTVYLRVLLLYSPAFILNSIAGAYVRNIGRPRLAMAAMLTSSLSNVVLDYVFMYPLDMGMFGAVLATGFSPVISITLIVTVLLVKKYRLPKGRLQFSLRTVGGMFALGFPSFISELSSGVVVIFFNYTLLRLAGNLGVAAYGITANLAIVVISVFSGLAQGAQPLVSTAHGKGDTALTRKLLQYSLVTALTLAAVFYVVALCFTDGIVSLFNSQKDAQLAALAGRGMRIYFSGFFFAGCNIVLVSYLSSVERPVQSFIVSFLRGIALIIPAVLLLAWLFGIDGVWSSFATAEGLTLLVAAAMLAADSFKKRRQCACQTEDDMV